MEGLPEERKEQYQGGDGEADPHPVTENPAGIGVAAAQPGREAEELTHRVRPRIGARGFARA